MRGVFQDKVEADFSGEQDEPAIHSLWGSQGGPSVDDSWHDDRSNYEYSE